MVNSLLVWVQTAFSDFNEELTFSIEHNMKDLSPEEKAKQLAILEKYKQNLARVHP